MKAITDGPNSHNSLPCEIELPTKIVAYNSMEDLVEASLKPSVTELAANNPNLMEYLAQLEKQIDQLHAIRNLKYTGAEIVRSDTNKPECIRIYVEIPYAKGVVTVCGTLGEAYDVTKQS